MTMTNEEIVRDYRAAKSKLKQIGILASLNACDNRTIVNILLEEGESVPGQFLQRGRKKASERSELVELEAEKEERFAFDQGLKAPKESFELDTDNPPLIRTEITVGALIAALESVPADAVIMEGFNAVKVIMDHNLSTGMRKTLVSIGRAEQ